MAFENPKIVVIGAGAMGGLFGGLLAEGGLDVTLVDTWGEHIATIASKGLRIVGVGGNRAIPDQGDRRRRHRQGGRCRAVSVQGLRQRRAPPRPPGTCSPARRWRSASRTASATRSRSARFSAPQNVMGGLTAQAGLVEAPGVVRNFGDLPTTIGEMSGGLSARATAIADAFTRHGLATKASADIKRDKWKKLLGNVALGAISAVTDLRSFEIMRVAELQEIVFRSVDEAAAVAKAEGIALDVTEAREVLMKLVDTSGGGTGNSKSSMREDIIRRRRTEIDTIHGSVQRLARKHGVATPTIDTMIALVKGLQSTYLQHG